MKKLSKIIMISILIAGIMAPSNIFAGQYASYNAKTNTIDIISTVNGTYEQKTQANKEIKEIYTKLQKDKKDIKKIKVNLITPKINIKKQQKKVMLTQNEMAQKVLELVNEKRREAGLKELTLSEDLMKGSKWKNDYMAQTNDYGHIPKDGTSMGVQGAKFYSTNFVGENIHVSYSLPSEYNDLTPQSLFQGWWNSPGHRANILNENYTQMGMAYTNSLTGVKSGDFRAYYATQWFGNPELVAPSDY
ncbi:hypothetical protein HMPREF9630_01886 [Peptoanaerobacter stomatis]|uniref:SCP domain-containing protein n=1 Tax=Peptoanaerobacter stomatis TaxID=796937 RepID=V9HP19_9FIRM|nr:CAP domain-containing protein [Peptoanaerobacter stomatis]EHL16486.1 hypothetical protein HMPREF9630_01886 [Peptoanaerobacter stomatis]